MAKKKKMKNHFQKNETIRLNKYLSDAGLCSRRAADEHIAKGEVTIDGLRANLGDRVSKDQKVKFLGKLVKPDDELILIAFNKPKGIECTTDKKVKNNVINYINYGKKIIYIGRLDKDSEGLLLLANDGDLAQSIARGRNLHEKEYIVKVNRPITASFIKGMESGVPILDTITRPCTLIPMDQYTFKIIITQGLNRQIRRMCEYFGYKVIELKRIRIMNINLGRLQVGNYRNITEKELTTLKQYLDQKKDRNSM